MFRFSIAKQELFKCITIFFVSFAKRKNKQTKRKNVGRDTTTAVANYSVHFFAIAAHCEMSLLVLLSFTHSKFIFSQGGSE